VSQTTHPDLTAHQDSLQAALLAALWLIRPGPAADSVFSTTAGTNTATWTKTNKKMARL